MKNDIFYIFSLEEINDVNIDVDILNVAHTKLSDTQSIRLFNSDILANKEVFVYKITPRSRNISPAVEKGKYYNDSDKTVREFLEKNKQTFGYSSLRVNKILDNIIEINSNNFSIKGDDGWGSLKDLFSVLNGSEIEYVVLRKYENLPYDFLEGDHDIDILCGSLDDVVMATRAKKRNIGINSYYLDISGIKTDFDVRFVGDNYIDSQWGRMILEKRLLNENGVFVMSDENQLFSILYHCLTQKGSISDYYKNKIAELSNKIFGYSFENNKENLCKDLALFMQNSSYVYRKPLDTSVVQNKKNIKLLKKYLRKTSKKADFIRAAYIKAPYRITSRLPKKTREKLYNLK